MLLMQTLCHPLTLDHGGVYLLKNQAKSYLLLYHFLRFYLFERLLKLIRSFAQIKTVETGVSILIYKVD